MTDVLSLEIELCTVNMRVVEQNKLKNVKLVSSFTLKNKLTPFNKITFLSISVLHRPVANLSLRVLDYKYCSLKIESERRLVYLETVQNCKQLQ